MSEIPKERARLVVCLSKRKTCDIQVCHWAVPRRGEPQTYECLLVGATVRIGEVNDDIPSFEEGRPRFWIGSVVSQPGGKRPFDRGVVLAVARRRDEFLDVTWQEAPLHTATHVVVGSGKGPHGLWQEHGTTGWFSDDEGNIPEGFLYYVEWASYSRGWAREEDLA